MIGLKNIFLLFLILACSIFAAQATNDQKFDAGSAVDPQAHVDYVINFDEGQVRKEDMDVVADWLKQHGIEVKESEMASYAAYQVATMNRALADELLAVGKERQLHIEEIEPDYLDWSDLDKEDL